MMSKKQNQAKEPESIEELDAALARLDESERGTNARIQELEEAFASG